MIEWSTNHTFVMKQLELLGFMLTADQSICTASLHTAAHGSQNCRSSGQASPGFSTCDPSSKNSDLAFALVKLRLRSSAGKMPRL